MTNKLFTMSDGLYFYQSQLSYIEKTLYETKFMEIIYPDLVPISFGLPTGLTEWSYMTTESIGQGDWIGDKSSEFPRADVDMKKFTQPLYSGGVSYGYSLDELEAAAASGGNINLEMTRITACKKAVDQHMQIVTLSGDTKKGVEGFFNQSKVPKMPGAMDWTVKDISGNVIVADCNALIMSIMSATKTLHLPDTLLVPLSQWSYMLTAKMDGPTVMSAIEYLKIHNPYTAFTNKPLTVKPVVLLDDAGASGKPRMIAYEKKRENLTMQIVQPFTMYAPQQRLLEFIVPVKYKFGPVCLRYPMSMAYRDFA